MRSILLFYLLYICSTTLPQPANKTVAINLDSLLQVNSAGAIGKTFPSFTANNKLGKINRNMLKGKVVFLNFWFASCPPCIAEFEGLNELSETLKDNPDFEMISFTYESEATIKKVREQYGLQYKIYSLDDNEIRRLNQNNGFPTNIILDKSGTISYIIAGGVTDKKVAKEFARDVWLVRLRKELAADIQ